MLNRHILRIKVMQSLYSFYTAKESYVYVQRKKLEDFFTPDALTDDLSDTEEKDEYRKLSLKLYDEYILKGEVPSETDVPSEVLDKVNELIKAYYNSVAGDQIRLKKEMIQAAESLQILYYKALMLPGEFQHLERLNHDRASAAHNQDKDAGNFNLLKNPVIESLDTHTELRQYIIKYSLSWQNDLSDIKKWYREIIKTNEKFQEYQQLSHPTYGEHQQIVAHLFKLVMGKNEVTKTYWEEEDIRWKENGSVLKSMLTKTVQGIVENGDQDVELRNISPNKEEDFEFFADLFDATLKEDEKSDELINEQTKNWDVSRLAMTDRIILKMALAEMVHFRSIPMKVTMNEYIEISKQYSTPKSKQFVNGILDVIANHLTSKGVIRKSGRGLIDNK